MFSKSKVSKARETWSLDQLLKSRMFHRKLHEWGLLETALDIESIKGEKLDWNLPQLNIDEAAWKKVIHRGIKPVVVFTHPIVLMKKPRRLTYYRMLAMVSQKSMIKVGMPTTKYESGTGYLGLKESTLLVKHLNKIISDLVNADEVVNVREFDLWRGMAAGTQAQGSWQNEKGKEAARLINEIVSNRIQEKSLGKAIVEDETRRFRLNDGRQIVIASEPDIGIYDAAKKILGAVEIKGGIDTAGVLERLGAALKSLSRAKRENPKSITILVLPRVAMTAAFIREVRASPDVDHYFAHDDIVNDPAKRKEFFALLGI